MSDETQNLPALPAQATITYEGGSCPVQIEGFVDGKPYYFRARGQFWTLGIGGDPVVSPEWQSGAHYSDEPYAAGYMSLSEARGFLVESLKRYLAGEPQDMSEHDEAQDIANALFMEEHFESLERRPDLAQQVASMRKLLEDARAEGRIPSREEADKERLQRKVDLERILRIASDNR